MMSACRSKSLQIAKPSGVFRLSVMLRLLALSNIKYQLSSPGFSPPRRRPWSPLVGSSTLMTSAPIHASISVHDGPASNCVRSSTRTPASALSMPTPPMPDTPCRGPLQCSQNQRHNGLDNGHVRRHNGAKILAHIVVAWRLGFDSAHLVRG